MDPEPGIRGSRGGFTLVLVTALALAALLGYRRRDTASIEQSDYARRAEHILQTTPLIDGHNDLPYLLRLDFQNQIYDDRFTFREGLASHTDLKRLQEGRLGGQFWSVFVECPETGNLDKPNNNVRDTLEQIDVAQRLFTEYPVLHPCTSSSCVTPAFSSGRIPSMLGAEGLHQAGSSIAVIRELFALGVRYMTLTHNCDNPFATAASTVTATGDDPGLTSLGRDAVREMNRLGMMVDLSHVSHQTMRDVLDIAESPVMFSHSSCYALAKNYRNAPDDVLGRLRENGGVIMIMFVQRFLNADEPEKADLETAVDHIFHAAKVAGWDHVGIGADFDGTVTLAQGIDDVASYPRIIEAVMRRGATDEQVRKLAGENILRVWRENEENARAIQQRRKPVEAAWNGRRWTRWNNPLPEMILNNPDRIRARDYA